MCLVSHVRSRYLSIHLTFRKTIRFRWRTRYMKHCNKDLAVAAEHQVARNETPGSRSAPMRGRHSPMTLTRAHQSASEKKTPQGL